MTAHKVERDAAFGMGGTSPFLVMVLEPGGEWQQVRGELADLRLAVGFANKAVEPRESGRSAKVMDAEGRVVTEVSWDEGGAS